MTPDSIVLLSPDAKLDALIHALGLCREAVRRDPCIEHLEASTAAWEALHGELMGQLAKESPKPADTEV